MNGNNTFNYQQLIPMLIVTDIRKDSLYSNDHCLSFFKVTDINN